MPPELTATCQSCGFGFSAASLADLQKGCPRCRTARKARAKGKSPRVETGRRDGPLTRVLVLERQGLSQNSTTYAHWSVHAKDKADWMRRLSPVVHQLGGTYSWSRWRITRTYGPRNRQMDFVNMAAGYKAAVDCLTELGVIFDDDPDHFVADYQQRPGAVTSTTFELLEYRFGDRTNVDT